MSFIQTKSPLSSLTIVSAVVSVIFSGLSAMGFQIAPDVVPGVNQIIAGIAAATAIYGRIRARTLIQ